jgi:hypothetical protein
MKTISAIAIFIAFSLNLLCQEVNLKLNPGKGMSYFINESNSSTLKMNSRQQISSDVKNLKGSITETQFNKVYSDQTPKKKKSVALGVVLSAIIPGAGEFYGEDYLKAGIFFGVEVLAWSYFIYFENKGNNQEADYQAYANKYWDVRTYARWLKNENFPENGGINPDEPDLNVLRDEIMVCERANFSHTMPEYYSQQYYELIGKYQNFQGGWTNLEHVPTRAPGPYWYESYHDPIFTNYANERQKANDYYDYAKIGPITAILNHILSAADAAWTISTYNNKIKMETGFRMMPFRSIYTNNIEMLPTFNLKVSF